MYAAQPIKLTDAERKTLLSWSQSRTVTTRQAERARIVLLAAAGESNRKIAEELGIKPHTAGRWRDRFAEHRVAGIAKDHPRGGRPREREGGESEIIRKTTQETPANSVRASGRRRRARPLNRNVVDLIRCARTTGRALRARPAAERGRSVPR